MVNSSRLYRLSNIETMVYDIQNELHRGVDDGFAAGAAYSKHRLSVLGDNSWCHAGQGSLLWCNKIGRSTNLAPAISDTWHSIEVAQLVV